MKELPTKTPPRPGRILLNTQMLADEFNDMGWNFLLNSKDKTPSFRGFELYTGQEDLTDGLIYISTDMDRSFMIGPTGKTKKVVGMAPTMVIP